MSSFHLRYVSRERIWLYALLGWRFTRVPEGSRNHHRAWSTIMRWNRKEEPKEPRAHGN